MASIFTKIIRGEIPCYKVAEDEKYFAFLDINPLMEGHTLVVPKKENDYIFDLDDDDLSGLMLFSKKVALGIEKAVPCARIGVAVVGLEVPHTHIHLVPINSVSDLNFKNPKLKLSAEEFEKIAKRINEKVIL
ncbi:MAG TPA: HIT family protein [Bacteroidales bacterium]|mgnify:FL=1|jgi:histidine triad (HIT) family protein|nr:HIT domain-containing protein [Bacteroidales bacterium]HNY52067.1 HIT family protein [Bacteroidales bacterium]HOG56120.1 HIT family protein [Bacteroidales bacterium]HPV17120.1 HIT family protein [Bacteroidales bacterium]HPX43170.1 HIT family protein [Bacteroidales bacterium]